MKKVILFTRVKAQVEVNFCKTLIRKGYLVQDIKRRSSNFNIDRIYDE